jgi:general secretion pathway protein D
MSTRRVFRSGRRRRLLGGPVVALALVAALGGCAALGPNHKADIASSDASQPGPPGTLAVAKKLIIDGQYEQAHVKINRELNADPTNANLHFLNALVYHLEELGGDIQKRSLAEVGYKAALGYDPTNATAAYCLGLLYIETGNYSGAVDSLAQSLIYDKHNEDAMRAFVIAAYYSRRPDLALGLINELIRRHGPDDELLRMKALTQAALNQGAQASEAAQGIKSPDLRQFVEGRIDQWHDYFLRADVDVVDANPAPASSIGSALADHNAQSLTRLAQDDDSQPPPPNAAPPTPSVTTAPGAVPGGAPVLGTPAQAATPGGGPVTAAPPPDAPAPNVTPPPPAGAAAAAPAAAPALPPTANGPRMAMIDLVIIQTEESSSVNSGVNLLDLLSASVTGGLNFSLTHTDAGTGNVAQRVLTGGVTIPATIYSLNIANQSDDKNDILARPTLTVLDGQPSTFDAGFTLTVTVTGQFAGNIADKAIGLNVTITPTFLSDSKVQLAVKVARSFFTPVEINAKGIGNAVEISNVDMTASAVVDFDQTLILSGLAERQQQLTRSQVPGLGDLPLIQYIFGQQQLLESTRTVMFLITPRKPKAFVGALTFDSDDSPAVKSLKKSEARWFGIKDSPNYLAIMHHFISNALYQEYRTGDLLSEVWKRPSAVQDRLKDLTKMLYF